MPGCWPEGAAQQPRGAELMRKSDLCSRLASYSKSLIVISLTLSRPALSRYAHEQLPGIFWPQAFPGIFWPQAVRALTLICKLFRSSLKGRCGSSASRI